jgi:hypothetical protein
MSQALANRRLQLATRIHYALMRELGFGIDVGRLMKQPLYARDVLLVCDGCSGHDLPRLAIAFRGLTTAEAEGIDAAGASQFASSLFHTSALPASQFPSARSAADAPQSLPPESVPAD